MRNCKITHISIRTVDFYCRLFSSNLSLTPNPNWKTCVVWNKNIPVEHNKITKWTRYLAKNANLDVSRELLQWLAWLKPLKMVLVKITGHESSIPSNLRNIIKLWSVETNFLVLIYKSKLWISFSKTYCSLWCDWKRELTTPNIG